jgi:superfamily II DNA or RNA helicase
MRRWQEEAMQAWFASGKRGIVSVVTGGGKTFFALKCINEFQRRVAAATVLITVPTEALLDQWFEELISFFDMPPRFLNLVSRSRPIKRGRMNIGVINTVAKLGVEKNNPEVFLVVDECHKSASPFLRGIFNIPRLASLGLSATPERPYDDWFEEVLVPNLGPVIYNYSYKEAMRDSVKGFAYWFVVEVEITTHHLEKHVIPQVTAFCEGRYEENTAAILSAALDVKKERAETLLATIPRGVIVVSNKRDEKWNQKLMALGVQHILIETYRNKTTSQTVHKIEGDLIPAYRSLGFGRVSLTDNVIITQVGQFWKEGSIDIHGPNGIAKWQCAVTNGRVWLMKEQGLIEFHNDAIVQFLLRQDQTLIVRLPYS